MRFTQFFESRARELSPEVQQWIDANIDRLYDAVNKHADSGNTEEVRFDTIPSVSGSIPVTIFADKNVYGRGQFS